MYACLYYNMYARMHAFMYVCKYRSNICMYASTGWMYVLIAWVYCMSVCMHACMHACMHVRMRICVCNECSEL